MKSQKDILDYQKLHKVEISGCMNEENEIGNFIEGTLIMSFPIKEKCLTIWHSHPPDSMFNIPEKIIYTPPSSSDIYFLILGSLKGLYNTSYIISYEGVYRISLSETVKNKAMKELDKIIESEDPFRIPFDPIVSDYGLVGYDFDDETKHYPFIRELLSSHPNYKFDNFNDAFADYKKELNKLGIILEFWESKYIEKI
jgi:hypothetical protein